MTELMRRRMALMAAHEGEPRPIFEIMNRTMIAGDSIYTDVRPLADNVSCTILMDYTIISNPTSGKSSDWILFAQWMSEKNKPGLTLGKIASGSNSLRTRWLDKLTVNFAGTDVLAGHYRYAFVHSANADTATFYYKNVETGPIKTKIVTGTYTPSMGILTVGSGTNTFAAPPGTINTFKAYDIALSDADINDFLAGG